MSARPRYDRRGVTLIELLVVIFILVTLTAALIPVMAPDMAKRRIREAARGVSTFLSSARARAIELGRPVGVVIRPMDNEPGASMLLMQAEYSAPYSGDTSASVCFHDGLGRIRAIGPDLASRDTGWISLVQAADSSPSGKLHPGDLIQFDHQGHWYRLFAGEPYRDLNENGIIENGEYADIMEPDVGGTNGSYDPPPDGSLDADGYFTSDAFGDGINSRFWYYTYADPTLPVRISRPVPPGELRQRFQILRQPSTTASEPLQLPEPMVIDMLASGDSGTPFGRAPATIFFSPSGSLDSVIWPDGQRSYATSSVHLLIGKRENVPVQEGTSLDWGDATPNWQDTNNLWVSIGHQTGQVTTSEIPMQTLTTALATAQINGGRVTQIDVSDGGLGYDWNVQRPGEPMPVTIVGGGGRGAQAEATVSGGEIIDIEVTAGGSGYTSEPTVIVSDVYHARAFARDAQGMGGN